MLKILPLVRDDAKGFLMEALKEIVVKNTTLVHGQGVYDTVRLAFGVPLTVECEDCLNTRWCSEAISRFAEGQFVAVEMQDDSTELVVGVASTMRTKYPPHEKPRSWMEAIGSLGIANHAPDGEWLYGVEMAVRPDFRKRGIGSKLYKARFELTRRLNLKGWYAVGMLMGYHFYRDQMTPKEYGEKVIAREIKDPTVTMQMNRGFEPWAVVENYLINEQCGDAAVLIVWNNPDYKGT